jgi:uncharacterized membrane protein
MSDIYCVQCGAVNQVGYQYCVGCGSYLAGWQPLRDAYGALPGIRTFNVSHVLALTLRHFTKRLWLITKIVFLVVAPFEVFKIMSLDQSQQDWQTMALALLLGAMCNVLIAPALIYALMKILETGVAPGVNESFRWGLSKLGRLGAGAAFAYVLQTLGYMLCIIPGIIVSLSLALVYPVAILEKGSLNDVLRRSKQLTRGHRWEILGAQIVMGLLILAVSGPIVLLVGSIEPPRMELFVFPAIVKDIAEQANTVLSLMMYLTLIRTPSQGNATLSLTN